MKQINHSRWAYLSKAIGVVAGISTLLLVTPAVQAQVLITGFYSQVGTNYLYNFQVKNQTTADVAVIEALYNTGVPAPVISNIVGVPGYTFDVDSVTGSIVFAEDTANFAPNSSVDGFRLTSSRFLNVTGVSGLNSDGSPFTGSFTSVAVPEAGTLPLGLLAASALLGTILIRRRIVA